VSRTLIGKRNPRALLAVVALTLTALAGVFTSPASAAIPTGSYEFAFQNSNGILAGAVNGRPIVNGGSSGQPMSANTSPDENNKYTVFRDPSGSLNLLDPTGVHRFPNLLVAPNTSPAVAALSDNSYEIAYQAPNSHLMTFGAHSTQDWGLGMMAGTSPAISAFGSGYEIAFQANTGNLWTVGSDNHGDWRLGMMRGTNPSITDEKNGHYEVAFQANTTDLWTVGSDNHGNWGLGMAPGTSPSITFVNNNGSYEVAFQANTQHLWTVGADSHGDWGVPMAPGTSPSITCLSFSPTNPTCQQSVTAYEVGVHNSAGSIATYGADNHGSWNLPMAAGTNPAVSF
jgi:hypothetical protein